MEQAFDFGIIADPDYELNHSASSATNLFAIIQVYCRLSKIANPSEEELAKFVEILNLAEYDPELGCLINEADHLIAYELGLSADLPHSRSSLTQILSHSISTGD